MWLYRATKVLFLLQIVFQTVLAEEDCVGDGSNNNVGDCTKKDGYFPSRQLDAAELYEDLKLKVLSVKESCGEICETRAEKENVVKEKSVWSKELEKSVKCGDLFSNKNFDANSNFPIPPKKVLNSR